MADLRPAQTKRLQCNSKDAAYVQMLILENVGYRYFQHLFPPAWSSKYVCVFKKKNWKRDITYHRNLWGTLVHERPNYILFPNNLVTNIVFPVTRGIYLENGIRPPFLFYKLDGFFLQVSWTVLNNVLSLWLIKLWLLSCSFVRAILCRVLVTWCR